MKKFLQNIQGTEEKFTIDEFLVALPKIISYIGSDKLIELIRGELKPESKKEMRSNEEIIERIRNRN